MNNDEIRSTAKADDETTILSDEPKEWSIVPAIPVEYLFRFS